MLVTKTAKNVTNTIYLLETHFVTNTRHQHRCNRYSGTYTIEYTDGEAVKIYIMAFIFTWVLWSDQENFPLQPIEVEV